MIREETAKAIKTKIKKPVKFADLEECHKDNKKPAAKAAMPRGVLIKRWSVMSPAYWPGVNSVSMGQPCLPAGGHGAGREYCLTQGPGRSLMKLY